MLKFNLHAPLSKLEEKNGRYSYARISDKSGISRQGVRRLLVEGTQQIDVDTLSKLLAFFAAEGMPITVGDLFTVTSTGE
jgi:hypothetical protein